MLTMIALNIPSPTPYITPNTIPSTDKELGEARKMSQLSDLQRAPANQVSSLVQPAVDLPNPSSQPSTVEGYHDIQELNQVLPPRRELPFLKPGMKRKRPELTAETIAEKPKSSRASKSASQAHCNTIERCDTMISNASSQSLVQTQVYVEPAEPVSTQPYSQPDKEIQLQGPNSQLTTTLCAAVPRDTSNNVQVERTQSPTQPAAPASIEEELTAYLSSPSSERVQFIENWMCELINDDRFMTLCQDVEATWKRFAFGIKK